MREREMNVCGARSNRRIALPVAGAGPRKKVGGLFAVSLLAGSRMLSLAFAVCMCLREGERELLKGAQG